MPDVKKPLPKGPKIELSAEAGLKVDPPAAKVYVLLDDPKPEQGKAPGLCRLASKEDGELRTLNLKEGKAGSAFHYLPARWKKSAGALIVAEQKFAWTVERKDLIASDWKPFSPEGGKVKVPEREFKMRSFEAQVLDYVDPEIGRKLRENNGGGLKELDAAASAMKALFEKDVVIDVSAKAASDGIGSATESQSCIGSKLAPSHFTASGRGVVPSQAQAPRGVPPEIGNAAWEIRDAFVSASTGDLMDQIAGQEGATDVRDHKQLWKLVPGKTVTPASAAHAASHDQDAKTARDAIRTTRFPLRQGWSALSDDIRTSELGRRAALPPAIMQRLFWGSSALSIEAAVGEALDAASKCEQLFVASGMSVHEGTRHDGKPILLASAAFPFATDHVDLDFFCRAAKQRVAAWWRSLSPPLLERFKARGGVAQVDGYASASGAGEHNQDLSDRRAAAVKAALEACDPVFGGGKVKVEVAGHGALSDKDERVKQIGSFEAFADERHLGWVQGVQKDNPWWNRAATVRLLENPPPPADEKDGALPTVKSAVFTRSQMLVHKATLVIAEAHDVGTSVGGKFVKDTTHYYAVVLVTPGKGVQ